MVTRATPWLLALCACAAATAPAPPLVIAPAPPAAPPRLFPFPPPPPGGPRLPRAFVPTRYEAHLAVGARLAGTITIHGDLAAPAALIWLHANELQVSAARITAASGPAIPLQVDARGRDEDAVIALRPAQPLPPGAYTLALAYTAPILEQALLPDRLDPADPAAMQVARTAYEADAARGAFREIVDGRAYVFTQFEALDARRVFPCLDEPDLKVPWQLTLDIPAGDTAASNTPIARATPLPDGGTRVEFAATRPIPSYVVAFAVGPFAVTDAGRSQGGVPIRVLVPQGQPGGAAALADGQLAGQLLDALAAWTQIPYAFDKLDLVAVPRTGNEWAAMENPGLVTFRARFLDRSEGRYRWLEVMAHELAHQWFGDLVTPAWWDDIWLSEGFATFLGTKLSVQLDPAWGAPSDRADDHEDALAAHGAGTVRLSPTASMREVEPYTGSARGGEVLQMIEGYLGAERFQRAARAYLAAHAGGSVTTADLVAALAAAAPDAGAIGGIVADAIDRAEVPVVASALVCARGRAVLHVRASRDAHALPVCVAYDRDGARDRACGVVAEGTAEIPLPARACPRWVLANAEGSGAYTVAAIEPGLVARGWSALTPAERALVRAEWPIDGDLAAEIPLVPALIAAGDPDARQLAVTIAGRAEPYVPAALRPAFAAWVTAHFAAAARALPLTTHDVFEPGVARADLAGYELVAAVQDPALVQGARAVIATLVSVDPAFVPAVLALVASSDPQLAVQILAQLVQAGDPRAAATLGHVPGILDQLARTPGVPPPASLRAYRALLASACDAPHRAVAVSLATHRLSAEDARAVGAEIDACITRRARLAPVIRAWLAP